MGKQRERRYFLLQSEFNRKGLKPRQYAADVFGMKKGTLDCKMQGRIPFDMAEVYTIMDAIHQPYERIPMFFPKSELRKKEEVI